MDYNIAINRYGGLSLWNKIDYVVIDIKKLGGIIPALKGIGLTFQPFEKIHIYPHAKRVIFFNRCQKQIATFENGKIIQNNLIISENHRLTFKRLRKYRIWNDADACYFFGAALTTYLGIPFILPELKTDIHKWGDGFVVSAIFPEPVHSHCAQQKFYFNKEGLLERHDYKAEIISNLATGSHITSQFKELKSLPIPCKRVVYVRFRNLVLPIPVLHAELEPVEVVLKNDTT